MKIFVRWFALLAVSLIILGSPTLSASAFIGNIAVDPKAGDVSIPEVDYWNLVQTSRDVVKQLKDLPEEKIKEDLAALAKKWEVITEVEVDGKIIPVDNGYLIAALTVDEPDLEKITGLLDALLTAHKEYPTKIFSTGNITSLNAILSRPEFQWMEPPPNPVGDWFQKLLDRLNEWLNNLLGDKPLSVPIDTLTISVFAFIFLALVLIYVFRTLFVDFMGEARISGEEDGENEPLTSEAAFEKAQALSRGGDNRSAVRYLYLSSLLLMDERGVLRYDRSKTNREYLRSVANSPELARPLEEVIEVFDNVWYGYHPLEEESFKHYSARVEELKEKKP